MRGRFLCTVGVISSAIWLASTARGADEITHTVMEGFPRHVQARLELKGRLLARLPAPPGDRPFETFDSVVSRLKLWSPGETIKIAFLGGDAALHKDIAEATKPWTVAGNIILDFGLDSQTGKYREWTRNDRQFAAAIRISFDDQGYWSLVGTDCMDGFIIRPSEASMNFDGFHVRRPGDWKATVLHEFGHALAFQHEHQHPLMGCETEFRFEDDLGYRPTRDEFEQFIPDPMGRRPGIYTVLGGPPNKWDKATVDHNLRELRDSHLLDLSTFDRDSIMKYHFDAWMFVRGTKSPCFTNRANAVLSPGDIAAAGRAYPKNAVAIERIFEVRKQDLGEVMRTEALPPEIIQKYDNQLRALPKK